MIVEPFAADMDLRETARPMTKERSHGWLLVVGDAPDLADVLAPGLASGGFRVDVAARPEDAPDLVAVEAFDAVVLDLETDGLGLVKALRRRSDVPIIVIAASGREDEKVEALDAGANDVVSKPIPIAELQARLRATIRDRCTHQPKALTWRHGDVAIDFETRRATIGSRAVRLTQKEAKFLSALAARAGRIASHRELISAIWGADADVDAQVVRVLAAQTRHKVEVDPSRPELIVTEPGLGYRLKV